MPVIITPNMGLIEPVVGQEPGPTWASDLNASLGILDQHNHTPGQGVQITPAGLNINTDLALNSHNLTVVNTVNFQALGSPLAGAAPNLGCVYVAGNELYYNDEAGNVVTITHNGSVNSGAGSITGLPSGTASASYSSISGTFIWEAATLTPANMDFASAVFRNQVVSSFGLTLSPPNAMSTDYGVILPPPNSTGSTVVLTYDTAGNIGLGSPIDHLSPSGSIIMYGGTSAPSGYVLCDGSSYLNATYPNLFGAIGTAYGSADASHFNVPDFRGIFPRGVSAGSGNDPDAASRTAANTGGNTGNNIGSLQTSAFASGGLSAATAILNVDVNDTPAGSGTAYVTGAYATAPNLVNVVSSPTVSMQTSVSTTISNSGASSTETRPINLYVNFIIKT